jgi:hypothetical protein
MPDFQPISEVICSSPFLISVFNHTPPYWPWFCHFAGYSTCPSCQDNPLYDWRPNFCFGMLIPYSGSTDVQPCDARSNSHQASLWQKENPISDCFINCQEEKNKQKATHSGQNTFPSWT